MSTDRPLILVSGCAVPDDTGRLNHKVGDKYLDALVEVSDATPLIVPALGDALDIDLILGRVDGLFLTGSPSNVEPSHYDGTPFAPEIAADPRRDSTTLPLIRAAIKAGLPLFAVCRGIQELNVALGGTLHQNVHELPGKEDHRMDRSLDYNAKYDTRHRIDLTEGSLLARLNDNQPTAMVNSLHAQAIDELAPELMVDAISPDGVIEAVSMPGAPGFVLGVQWHPEHPVSRKWTLSQAMFKAFRDAALSYRRNPSNKTFAA